MRYCYLLSFCLFCNLCSADTNWVCHFDHTFMRQNRDSVEVKKLDSIKARVSAILSSPIKKKDLGKNILISKTH